MAAAICRCVNGPDESRRSPESRGDGERDGTMGQHDYNGATVTMARVVDAG